MDPISAGLAIGGSIIKGVAGLKAGQQNKRMLDAQSIEETRAGEQQALRIRDQARQAIGQQVGAQFSNGFQGGSGSALDALTESQINSTLDMMEIRRQAAGKARSLTAQGQMANTQGKFALASSLIGGASSVYGMSQDWAAARTGSTPAPRTVPNNPGDIVVTRGGHF